MKIPTLNYMRYQRLRQCEEIYEYALKAVHIPIMLKSLYSGILKFRGRIQKKLI